MKQPALLAALTLMGLSGTLWGAATVLLNNYDSNNAILSWAFPAGGPVPVPTDRNAFVQLLGGPSATQLLPVTVAGGTASVFPIAIVPGFFDAGVGVVPGVADNAVATFRLVAWQGRGISGEWKTSRFGSYSTAASRTWTQGTGSWNPGAVPPFPASGPPLNNPALVIGDLDEMDIDNHRGPGSAAIVASAANGPLDRWTSRASGTASMLFEAAYGNNTFVAVGEAGTILTSPEGMIWTSRPSGTTNNLLGIAYGNQTYVAVGWAGTVLTSTEGTGWTVGASGTTDDLVGVAYGNRLFAAVARSGAVVTSPDGSLWTQRTLTDQTLFSIAFGNDLFVVSAAPQFMLTSPDATSWTPRFATWGGAAVAASKRCTAYGNNRFVTVGDQLYISTDEVTWFTFSNAPAGVRGVTFAEETFVVAGDNGHILSSKDGLNWTNHAPATAQGLNSVAYGNDTFVAVGESGTILQSAPLHPTAAPALLSGRIVDGGFELTLSGSVGQSYVIQSANDLSGSIQWQTLATLTLTNGNANWRDNAATNRPQRYYRAITLP